MKRLVLFLLATALILLTGMGAARLSDRLRGGDEEPDLPAQAARSGLRSAPFRPDPKDDKRTAEQSFAPPSFLSACAAFPPQARGCFISFKKMESLPEVDFAGIHRYNRVNRTE